MLKIPFYTKLYLILKYEDINILETNKVYSLRNTILVVNNLCT